MRTEAVLAYICNTCNRRHTREDLAKRCEASHNCTHENLVYRNLVESCKTCGIYIGHMDFSGLSPEENKQAFDILKQNFPNIYRRYNNGS